MQVSPAPAGMIPVINMVKAITDSEPRTRGDDPHCSGSIGVPPL